MLEENACREHAESGIFYTGEAGGTARRNACVGNRHGISVQGQAQPILDQNTCYGNSGFGLMFADEGGGTATENSCLGNLYGIAVGDAASPTLEGNRCSNNHQYGIALSHSAAGAVRRNVCERNGEFGIWVIDRASPVLEANLCRDNRGDGVSVSETARPTLVEADEDDRTRDHGGDRMPGTAGQAPTPPATQSCPECDTPLISAAPYYCLSCEETVCPSCGRSSQEDRECGCDHFREPLGLGGATFLPCRGCGAPVRRGEQCPVCRCVSCPYCGIRAHVWKVGGWQVSEFACDHLIASFWDGGYAVEPFGILAEAANSDIDSDDLEKALELFAVESRSISWEIPNPTGPDLGIDYFASKPLAATGEIMRLLAEGDDDD
jgi:parallel beta-helix repeat protein